MRKFWLWLLTKLIKAPYYKCHVCGLQRHDLEVNSLTIHQNREEGAWSLYPACVHCLRVLAELWVNGRTFVPGVAIIERPLISTIESTRIEIRGEMIRRDAFAKALEERSKRNGSN